MSEVTTDETSQTINIWCKWTSNGVVYYEPWEVVKKQLNEYFGKENV
jgi:hypothetical protein